MQCADPSKPIRPTRAKTIRQALVLQDITYEIAQKLRDHAAKGTKEDLVLIGEILSKVCKTWKEMSAWKRKLKWSATSKKTRNGVPVKTRNGLPVHNGSAVPAGRKRVKSPALEPVYDVQPPPVVVTSIDNPDAELDPLE